MFKNYFKTGWRNLTRNKSYAAINIIGLSLGIACSILIFTVVSYHLSFENFNHNKDRIYRIVTEVKSDNTFYSRGTPSPLAKAMRNDFSFAEKSVRVAVFWKMPVNIESSQNGLKKFNEENGVAVTSSDFFDIFNFPLVEGNIQTALTEPNTAIITQKLAKKYFGEENPMGKTIRINNKTDFKITGVLKDIPINTDRSQEIYVSDKSLKEFSEWQANDDSWGGFSSETNTFLLLKPGVSAASVASAFPQIMKKYYVNNPNQNSFVFHLQPLNDIHFNTEYEGYADKKYLWSAALIGLLLIVTAAVNFINLATAQAVNRSKEIGIRKVLGSMRNQLFWQFIAETTLITVFATIIAFVLAQMALPFVNMLFTTQLSIDPLKNMHLLGFILTVTVAVIFLSGSYPGLILAGFKPIAALKGKASDNKAGGFSLRRALVITQFSISQLLIIGTIIIASQMNFSKYSDLGFDKENIVMVTVPLNDSIGNLKMKELVNDLKEIPSVKNVSLCMEAPGADHSNMDGIRYDNRAKDELWGVNGKTIDANYLATFNLKLVAGRNIYPSDTINQYIVNETVIRKLGLSSPQEAINKKLTLDGISAPIVGVVKDFYDKSFRSDINPVVMFPLNSHVEHCAVKISNADIKSSLAAIAKTWNAIYPQYVYRQEFLDEKIAKYYALDDIMLKLIEFFAGIAIVIGCLGLYGLVSFMVAQKTKEIGVRKVLGASVQSILWLFGKEFSRLVFIAFVIAAPVAWWLMNKYLQDFKFRIHIGVSVFVLAILITLVIAVITVGYRSLRAAMANPVKSLRSE
ncbi:MAG: ABC transporter permease [Bacteroidetes bacterium]|nr:ABC transporter permease [Bacteroidota bacterium]